MSYKVKYMTDLYNECQEKIKEHEPGTDKYIGYSEIMNRIEIIDYSYFLYNKAQIRRIIERYKLDLENFLK